MILRKKKIQRIILKASSMALWKKTFISATQKLKNINSPQFQVIFFFNATEDVIKREFDAFKPIRDASPKYVLSLDKVDLSHDGIIHLNIEDFLLRKRDLLLS